MSIGALAENRLAGKEGSGMPSDDDRVLDSAMLETLAIIAAANERSLVEELNRAVETYVRNEIALCGNLSALENLFPSASHVELA